MAVERSDKQKRSIYAFGLAAVLGGFALLQVRRLSPGSNSNLQKISFRTTTDHRQLDTPHRMAVARPFCDRDAIALAESFEQWDEVAPCHHGSKVDADLFLVYAGSLDASPSAQSAVDSVTQRFHETNGWNGCFDRVVAFGVNIDPDYDLYDRKQQQTNFMWVNGPNRQFERTVRELQTGTWGEYETMYLMERDSVPVKSFWLDVLVSDVEARQPFAILGSKYRGDKWDSFYSQLPPALLNHINGNAVYNLTHPLFNLIVAELEVEAQTVANAIPYDYRISQIMEEGNTGVVPDFPDLNAPEKLPSMTATFSSWVQKYGLNANPIQETSLLGNYADTNMIPSLIGGDEVVIHGANMYEPWDNEEMGDVTLVVSDWQDSNANTLLSNLKGAEHPFSRVVAMLPDDSNPEVPETSVPVEIYHRAASPDFMDICSAPVNTKWFMITNSYHRVKPKAMLMMHKDDDGTLKPLVSYASANEQNCFQHSSCARDIGYARSIYPQADRAFRNDDLVFHTASRNKYCEILKEQRFSDSPVSPSATGFIAHLQKNDEADTLYKFSDRTLNGSRDVFVRLPVESLSPLLRTEATRRLHQDAPERNRKSRDLVSSGDHPTNPITEGVAVNETTSCTMHVDLDECVSAGCEWNSRFNSCRSAPGNAANQLNELQGVGGFSGQPQWAKALIGVVVGGGCILAIGLLGATAYKRNTASRANSGTHYDFGDVNVEDDDLSDIFSVGAVLRDLEGGPSESATVASF